MNKTTFSKIWDGFRYTLLGLLVVHGVYALVNGQDGTPPILRWCICGYIILHFIFKYALKIYVPEHDRRKS